MNLKDAIREAVDERDKQEDSKTPLPESDQAINTASHKEVNTASSKAVQGTFTPISQALGSESTGPETAAMTVRVPRRHRLHWLISAKQQGTSLTAAITQALNERFGEPVD